VKARFRTRTAAGLLVLLSSCDRPTVRPADNVGIREESRADAARTAQHCKVHHAEWNERARMLYVARDESLTVRQCVADQAYWASIRHEPSTIYRLIVGGI